ncbi:hypothetical protein T4A_6911, partial [Trichinella pseudospiralis]
LVYISERKEPGLRTVYLYEAKTKKRMKILMETAFLPLYEVPAAEDLPDRNVTGSVASQLCLLENT